MRDIFLSNDQMKELTLLAKKEFLDIVLDFVNSILQTNKCPVETQIIIAVAVEEIYVNIASYSYAPNEGEATIRCIVDNTKAASCITIEFIDSGRQYNPLLREIPDITMEAESRPIGGLGIFIVKNTMDEVAYRYEDDKNILTIKKYL